MTQATFQEQIRRLQNTYGEKAYSTERTKLFWRTYQKENDAVFIAAVDLAIASSRSTPLFKEFDQYIIEARKAECSQKYAAFGGGTIPGIMQEAERVNKVADKDFVKMCIMHLGNFMQRKIDLPKFLSGCDDIAKLAEQLNPQIAKRTPYYLADK